MSSLATDILACEARIAANRRVIALLSRGADTPDLLRQRLLVWLDTVLWQLDLLSLLWDAEDEKAGFRPDQPRHPRGSGPISGRWSGGAGTIIVEGADPASVVIIEPAGGKPGHHYVPQSLISRLNLTPEARRLLMDATTGKLKEEHRFDVEHRKYNEAVGRHVDRFLSENGIGSRPMTADEAQRLLNSVLRSNDPDIWKYSARLANKPPRRWSFASIAAAIIWFFLRRGR